MGSGVARKGSLLALAALGGLAGFAVICLALIANRSFTTHVALSVLDRLDAQLPVDIRFKHFSVQPLTGVIAVDDLTLAVPGKPNRPLPEPAR